METKSRFLTAPAGSFFLLGPRGTGKTTWLKARFPGALFVDLLQSERFRELAARPERLAELVEAQAEDATIVVDEVQRIPELLNVVHGLMERGSGRRFVLTGSSARKLRRGGVDLLAGRAVVRAMHPFLAGEWPDCGLAEALETGLVPLVRDAEDPKDTLAAYATLYLEEEVRSEGFVRNIGNFARFLEAVSFSHGSVLNISSVARECQVERKTVAGYIEILDDLLLSFRVPVFARRAKRKTVAHPKLYLFDVGVFRSLRPRGPLDRPTEIEGAALEGLVAQHLRAWIDYSGTDATLSYWRTQRGVEVDFVLYGAGIFDAIEVKNAARVQKEHLRGLKAFCSDYPECRPLLLYRGADPLVIDGVRCLPVEGFLRALDPSRTIASGG